MVQPKNIFVLLSFLFALMSACVQQDEYEMINGIKSHYFIKNENAQPIQVGNVLVMNLRYTTMNDSVIFDSKEIPNFKMRLSHSSANIPTIDDALAMMHVGDSALFLVSAESFYVTTKRGSLPTCFNQDDVLKFYIKIKDVLTLSDYQKSIDNKNHSSFEMEESLLKRYLLHANINTKPMASGLYFIEEKKGAGNNPEPSDMVTIEYSGTFIDGKLFDTTYKKGKPFTFKFGIGNVIPGLDEGIAKMKKGGKAKIIIPSNLAYGSKGSGPIPPNTTLIFDVELIDIKTVN